VKRRYKLLIFILALGVTAWVFPMLPRPTSNVPGILEGLFCVAAVIGALIWVVWPRDESGRAR
jgi:hypothetical protein